MRVTASKAAPAVKDGLKQVKQDVRHGAMSFCLAGIVATLVLNSFKVSLVIPSPLLLCYMSIA